MWSPAASPYQIRTLYAKKKQYFHSSIQISSIQTTWIGSLERARRADHLTCRVCYSKVSGSQVVSTNVHGLEHHDHEHHGHHDGRRGGLRVLVYAPEGSQWHIKATLWPPTHSLASYTLGVHPMHSTPLLSGPLPRHQAPKPAPHYRTDTNSYHNYHDLPMTCDASFSAARTVINKRASSVHKATSRLCMY